jgi:hypothetical protein
MSEYGRTKGFYAFLQLRMRWACALLMQLEALRPSAPRSVWDPLVSQTALFYRSRNLDGGGQGVNVIVIQALWLSTREPTGEFRRAHALVMAA